MKALKLNPLFIALLAAGLVSGAALAEESKDPNRDSTKAQPSETAQAVDNLLLANQLAAYAQSNNDALGMVVAARMIQDQPTSPSTAQKEGGTDNDASEASITVEDLLKQAREQSGGRAEIVALIDETATRTVTKGKVGGPIVHNDRVRGNTIDIFRNLKFKGGEVAIIGVLAGSHTDIDCSVYDQNGNLIVSDTDGTSTCALRWKPLWTGPFRLEITNLGSKANSYRIITN